MGLLRRCSDVVTANVNDLVDRLENPEKMLKQAVREMEEAVTAALEGAAKVIASERLLARQVAENREHAEQQRTRARECISRGDEAGARAAAARVVERERLIPSIEAQRAAAEDAAKRLRQQVDGMQARFDDARRQLTSLIARRRAAEAQRVVASHAKRVGSSSAFARYDRFERDVETTEAEARALGELQGVEWCAMSAEEDREREIANELARLRNARTTGV